MRARAAAVALALLGAASLGVERPPGLADVLDVRHWSYDGYTRVVVETSAEAESEIHRLPSDPAAGRPERLYVDLRGVWVGRRYEAPITVRDGLLEGVRVGQNTLDTTRVVLDLQRYGHHRVLRLHAPDRVVIDVYGDRAASPDHASGGAPPGLPLDLRGVRTVVIDPGHGGRDPGAIGAGGLREKDVTLRLAKKLAAVLRARDFGVILTRSDDRTLSLEERTAIAAGAGGDVFVSLHCNASRRRAAHGIETYYLDESNQRQTLRVAARENGMDLTDFDSLDRTLAVLRVAETSDYSGLLAGLVHREMIGGLRRHWKDVNDLGVKQGPFYVLFLSSMPSILVETGFITHRAEARRLRHDRYLDTLARQIAAGLESYRKRIETVIAQRQP